MPVAVIDPNKFKRYELKTAPANPDVEGDEDGYVMLRPLPYGMLLDRNDETLSMQMRARRPQDRRQKGQAEELPEINMKNLNAKSTQYDFAYCIGDHNLTDMQGNKLDFTNPLVFKVLDPRVAQEISTYIDELNNPEEDLTEDFIKRATSSPSGEKELNNLLRMEDSGQQEKEGSFIET